MKKVKFLLAITMVTLFTPLFSQNVALEMGLNFSTPKIYLGGSNIIEQRTSSSQERKTFSIGLTAKIYNNFYLKTEIGSNAYNQVLEVTYKDPISTTGKSYFFGRYSREQFYFAILSEIRFFKKYNLFANVGIGAYQNIVSSGLTGSKHSALGLITNLGFTPYFNDNLGLLFNIGYTRLEDSPDFMNAPSIGVRQFNVKLGFTYVLR